MEFLRVCGIGRSRQGDVGEGRAGQLDDSVAQLGG